MKAILEEIVNNLRSVGDTRYRRRQLGVFDVPVELLPVLQDGYVLTIDGDDDSGDVRRKLVIANVRMAAIIDIDHIGLIIDLIDPALHEAIESDQDAPADYKEFCELEGIKP